MIEDLTTPAQLQLLKDEIHEAQKHILYKGVVFWPETPEMMLDQLRRVELGIKPAMLWHKLSMEMLPTRLYYYITGRGNLLIVETCEGALVWNSNKLKVNEIKSFAHSKETIGRLLGYGDEAVPTDTDNTYALKLFNAAGIEKECLVVTEENMLRHREVLKSQFEQGDYFEMQSREDFRNERWDRFNFTGVQDDKCYIEKYHSCSDSCSNNSSFFYNVLKSIERKIRHTVRGIKD